MPICQTETGCLKPLFNVFTSALSPLSSMMSKRPAFPALHDQQSVRPIGIGVDVAILTDRDAVKSRTLPAGEREPPARCDTLLGRDKFLVSFEASMILRVGTEVE